jgi:hypothetical protein
LFEPIFVDTAFRVEDDDEETLNRMRQYYVSSRRESRVDDNFAEGSGMYENEKQQPPLSVSSMELSFRGPPEDVAGAIFFDVESGVAVGSSALLGTAAPQQKATGRIPSPPRRRSGSPLDQLSDSPDLIRNRVRKASTSNKPNRVVCASSPTSSSRQQYGGGAGGFDDNMVVFTSRGTFMDEVFKKHDNGSGTHRDPNASSITSSRSSPALPSHRHGATKHRLSLSRHHRLYQVSDDAAADRQRWYAETASNSERESSTQRRRVAPPVSSPPRPSIERCSSPYDARRVRSPSPPFVPTTPSSSPSQRASPMHRQSSRFTRVAPEVRSPPPFRLARGSPPPPPRTPPPVSIDIADVFAVYTSGGSSSSASVASSAHNTEFATVHQTRQ